MPLFSRAKPAPVTGSYTGVAAIRGAAQRIDLTGERQRVQRKAQEDWQAEAWELFGAVGEVRQAARIFGDAFSRCRWYVGVRPSPEDDPVPVDEDNAAELGVSLADAAAAEAALERLHSPRGGQTELRRNLGIQLFVPGECYLVGRPDPESPTGERWDIHSTAELSVDGANREYVLRSAPSPGGDEVHLSGADTIVSRIYRPHPQYSAWADSPMRSALPILTEYRDLTDSIRASARSRAYGPGVWVLPNSMRRGVTTGEASGEGDGQAGANDQVVTDLVEATGAAIADLSSPFARVPVMVWVDDDLWREKDWSTTLVTWDREVDRVAADQRAELIKRFAVAIDLPAEVLTGIAGMNHWSAWQVPESAFRDHLAPALVLGCDGVTIGYLRPALELARVESAARWEVWFDPSPLLTNVNQAEDYKDAYDRFEASGEALRRVLSIPEEDAPEDDEVMRRIQIEAMLRQGPAVAGGSPPERGTPEPEREMPPSSAVPTVVAVRAAGAPPEATVPGLPETLAEMDANLLRDLHQAADAAMRRALERANARLKSLAKRDPTARAAVEGVLPATLGVAPTLGPTLVTTLADGEDLFSGAWDGILARFRTRTGRVTAEAIRLAAAAGELSDLDAQAMLARLDEDREAGAGLLLAGLTALASTLLARPEPIETRGESDGSLVPPEAVRRPLIRSGGGGEHATSLLTALDVHELFRRSGIALEGRVWRYGDPAARLSPFEPHRALDGVEFESWDDPALAASGGWPFVGHYSPQDHVGCLCSAPYRVARRLDERPTIVGQEVA